MAKGDQKEIEPTEQEIAQFEIAKDMWDRNRETAPQTDAMLSAMTTGYVPDGEGGLKIADNQHQLNDDGSVRIDAGQADAQAGAAWNEVQNKPVDPNGGGRRLGIGLMEDRIKSQSETGSRVRLGQQNRHIKAVENMAALARGQEAEALRGMQQQAGEAANEASNDAVTSYNDSQNKRYAIGQGVGFVGGVLANKYKNNKDTSMSGNINGTGSAKTAKAPERFNINY